MSDEPIHPDQAEPRARRRVPKLRRPRRLRTLLLFSGVGLWLVLLGMWIASGGTNTWREWLANLKFLEKSSKGSGSQAAHRAEGPPKLGYFGDGKAELGEYSVRTFDPITRTTLRTDFRLEGQTSCTSKGTFEQFMKNNHRFFREQVMVTLRNCQLSDLTDPDLQLLERKLVSRVNRALGRRFLKSAEIKDFFLYESVEDSGFVEYEILDDAATP